MTTIESVYLRVALKALYPRPATKADPAAARSIVDPENWTVE
jgi:hypothetical protein